MSKLRLAIIGNGMVGHRFIEELLEKAEPNQFEITVFCEEPRVAYDRVHLSSYFRITPLKSFHWFVKASIRNTT